MKKTGFVVVAVAAAAGLHRSWPWIARELSDKLDGWETRLEQVERFKIKKDLASRPASYVITADLRNHNTSRR